LAFADQRGRIGPVAALHKFAGNFSARAGCERAQFVKRFFGTEIGSIRPAAGTDAGRVIPRRLGRRRNGSRRSFSSPPAGAELHPHQKRPFPALGGVHDRLEPVPHTFPPAQSRLIFLQVRPPHADSLSPEYRNWGLASPRSLPPPPVSLPHAGARPGR